MANRLRAAIPGMCVTGVTGGLIGFFMGGLVWIIMITLVGIALGAIIWNLGGQRFFLWVTGGAVLGALMAIGLSDMEAALMGAAAGGSIGGFVSVNLGILKPRKSP